MAYYNYHHTAKKLIAEGKLESWSFVEKYKKISPALVLVFNDTKHPMMPIREYRWEEYRHLLPPEKQLIQNENT